MRRDVVVIGGVALGMLVALAIGAGWMKRGAPVALAATKVIRARKLRMSVPPTPEEALDDLVDRYRRAAAI